MTPQEFITEFKQDWIAFPKNAIDTIYHFCKDPNNWILHDGYISPKRIIYAIMLLFILVIIALNILNYSKKGKYFIKRVRRKWRKIRRRARGW